MAKDFGDIMDEWERSPRKKALSGSDAVRRSQEAWMERHGVPDAARREIGTEGGNPPTRAEIRRMPIDGTLDLHGMTAVEAEAALDRFFGLAAARRWRKVLIVHGKGLHSRGGAVLGKVVSRWLERHPLAGRSANAEAGLGGSGATWVLLKGGDQRSR